MRVMKNLAMVLALAFMPLVGCHELGHIEGPGDYGSLSNEVVGEVMNVDTRGRQIDIRTNSGRTSTVRYDNNTQVIYRQRNYAVANLERGDYVAARIQQDRDGRSYTPTITVRESAQDRGYGSGGTRLDRLEGRVEYVDSRRGSFELRDSRNRMRNGDYVRLEGRSVSADRFDLERFL